MCSGKTIGLNSTCNSRAHGSIHYRRSRWHIRLRNYDMRYDAALHQRINNHGLPLSPAQCCVHDMNGHCLWVPAPRRHLFARVGCCYNEDGGTILAASDDHRRQLCGHQAARSCLGSARHRMYVVNFAIQAFRIGGRKLQPRRIA